MTPTELVLRRSLPVFINSFNQPHYLRDLIANLSSHGFSNLWILDNDSTYPPLLGYYAELTAAPAASPRVLYYPGNFGPRHFHLSGLYRSVWPYPHFFTDPDLLFTTVADTFATTLLDLSIRYRVAKVGAALTLPPLESMTPVKRGYPETDWKPVSVLEWEKQFWANEIEEEVYGVSIDTTFHLFNPEFFNPDLFLQGIRVARPGYQAKHRPWFIDDLPPNDELAFYRTSRVGHGDWV